MSRTGDNHLPQNTLCELLNCFYKSIQCYVSNMMTVITHKYKYTTQHYDILIHLYTEPLRGHCAAKKKRKAGNKATTSCQRPVHFGGGKLCTRDTSCYHADRDLTADTGRATTMKLTGLCYYFFKIPYKRKHFHTYMYIIIPL